MAASSNDTRQALAQQLSEQVQAAATERTPLSIQGGASKTFYGRRDASNHPVLTLTDYQGVISFEPTELTVTAAAGTPLVALEQTLAERNQQLPFEPPHFGPDATLGGTIACGLSGPARPYTGSARDFVLGMKIINGRGEIINFGGQVMKNVAGYDVSRLLTGSLGTLGVILEVSLKVLPRPAQELTLTQSCDEEQAIDRFSRWAGKPYPISAAAYYDGTLYLRLAGAASAVTAAQTSIGGDILADGPTFWQALREQELDFFRTGLTAGQGLWRLSIPPATAPLRLPGTTLLDWGGAQRWLFTELSAEAVFAAAKSLGGQAQLFRGGDRTDTVFQPLPAVVMQLHRNLKQSFDPHGVLNPGRMYPEF